MKTLKIYSNLPESEKKEWYSMRQLISAFFLSIRDTDTIRNLDQDDRVRNKHFVVQSEDYKYHLKNNPKEDFLGVMWSVDKLYNYSDFKKVKDEYKADEIVGSDIQADRSKSIQDLRTHLNDIRSLENSTKIMPVVFYGDKKDAIVHDSRGEVLRNYYGLFLNYDYMKRWFCEIHDIRDNVLDALLFLHVYKFFIFTDWLHFHKVNLSFRTGKNRSTTSARKFFEFLREEGYIKEVEYTVNSKNKASVRSRKNKKLRMYQTSDKANKTVDIFMDYVTYKRKMEFSGKAKNITGVGYLDIKDTEIFNSRWKSTRHYIFYEFCYDYVNYKSEVEFFDGNLKEFESKLSSDDFCFNPMIYKMSEAVLLSSNGKNMNTSYISNFLNAERFGRNS